MEKKTYQLDCEIDCNVLRNASEAAIAIGHLLNAITHGMDAEDVMGYYDTYATVNGEPEKRLALDVNFDCDGVHADGVDYVITFKADLLDEDYFDACVKALKILPCTHGIWIDKGYEDGELVLEY